MGHLDGTERVSESSQYVGEMTDIPSRYVDIKYILGGIDKVHIGQELATTRHLNKVPLLSFSFPPTD